MVYCVVSLLSNLCLQIFVGLCISQMVSRLLAMCQDSWRSNHCFFQIHVTIILYYIQIYSSSSTEKCNSWCMNMVSRQSCSVSLLLCTELWTVGCMSMIRRVYIQFVLLAAYLAYSPNMKMQAECSSETLVNFWQCTRDHISEDNNFRSFPCLLDTLMYIPGIFFHSEYCCITSIRKSHYNQCRKLICKQK
jgi:hypothetical protein